MHKLPRWYEGLLLLAGVGVLFIGGCETVGEQRTFEAEAFQPPEGITKTTESGEIIDEDPSDWRTSPIYRGIIVFDPAFPNPISSSHERVTIPYQVIFDDVQGGLFLRAYDNSRPPRFVLLDVVENVSEGFYQLELDPTELSTSLDLSTIEGLHRLFVFDGRGNLVTYGDLRIKLEEE